MSTRRAVPVAAVALVGALTAAVLVAVLHRPGGTSVLPGPRAVSVRSWLSPRDPQFGDTVLAGADVLVDPRRVDPASVRLRGDLAPYRVLSKRRDILGAGGGYSVVRLEERLRCLRVACVAAEPHRTFRFAPLRVTYRQGAARKTLTTSWPVLRVQSRVAAGDLVHPVLRTPTAPPTPRYRFSPSLAGYALVALAAVLACAGAILLLRVAFRAAAPRLRRPEPLLDRILGELAAASSNGDSDRRRKALEQLALALEQVDDSLSSESRVLAWGRDDPRSEAISELAKRVRAVSVP